MQILMCLFFGQVAELVDAKVSKTFGAIPRAGSIPALTTNGEIKQDTANLIIKINFILVFLITKNSVRNTEYSRGGVNKLNGTTCSTSDCLDSEKAIGKEAITELLFL